MTFNEPGTQVNKAQRLPVSEFPGSSCLHNDISQFIRLIPRKV